MDSVRIGLSPKSALVTQVVMDMTRRRSTASSPSPDGNDLTVVFDEPVADPIAALRTPAAAAAAAVDRSGPRRAVSRRPRPTRRPAAPMRAAQDATGQGAPAPSKYTGHPVSLDFQGADLRAVLRTFAEISGLNIVIDPTVVGYGGRGAARRAVGSGARHHPARQQARLLDRWHHRARRAADGAVGGREAAPAADGRAGTGGRTASADPAAQLRQGRGRHEAAQGHRAVVARHRFRWTRAPTR